MMANSAHGHPFYGTLINHHLKSILNSGLLLDEDLEVLLINYRPKRPPERPFYAPYLKVVPSALAAIGGCVLWRRYNSSAGFLIALAFGCFEIKNFLGRRRQRGSVNKAIDVLIKIRSQNSGIIRYIKTREELGTKHKDQDKSVTEFIKTIVKIDSRLFDYYMNTLSYFALLAPELNEDFGCMTQINFNDLLGENNSFLRLHDLHVLFASKFLSYLGMALCSETLNTRNLQDILDVRLRELLGCLQSRLKTVHEQFDDLRYSAGKLSEIKPAPRKAQSANISVRLHNTLVQSVNNISVIMEKAHILLDKIESEGTSTENIGKDIVDLKDHLRATYESLDVLCRLYGILSNAKVKESLNKPMQFVRKPEESEFPEVSYNDVIEPQEERYRLYINENEKPLQNTTTQYEDQSGQYLNLMLRELKQSLKKHERFISAKTKRKSTSSSDEEEKDLSDKLEKPRPRFKLDVLESSKNINTPKQVDVLKGIKNETPDLVPPPPVPVLPPPLPPPPPPPEFNLSDLQQESGFQNSRSMLQNIKALSSQINVVEEVFGDSCDSDESENSIS